MLGITTGINTYSKMIEVFKDQVDRFEQNQQVLDEGEPQEDLSKNKLISNYLAKAKQSQPGSSFHGRTGKTNLVATLGDIFMGGT
jgi:hypothetical protein